ncbi:MAG: SDR family NAD(P)-dependent oxidoreductase [Caldiserica bacterium]|jgi:NAD(P)-dependent dehydrogenase (short-subunit alcohol dehydrogenase family)|nr:SDR family NAD(P)-dependent oxidoreductase [Caldisericota bacterium]MDH7562466.1 SDR family NAD(P)-dependent oxidoreductase [Caldisericota bacterium]
MIELQEARDLSRPENLLKINAIFESKAEPVVLSREVIMVCGGSSKTALGLVSSLLNKGFRIAALGPIKDDLSSLNSQFPNLLLLSGDPGDSGELRDALDLIVGRWGGIHVLVNIICPPENLPRGFPTMERARECFEKLFFIPLKVTLEVLPQMRKQGTGIVHNLISPLCFALIPGTFPFSASERAVEALSFSFPSGFLGNGVYMNLMLESILSGGTTKDDSKFQETGEKLSRAILVRKSVISPDLPTGIFLFLSRRFPFLMGKIATKLLRKAL